MAQSLAPAWKDAEIRINGIAYPCRAIEHTVTRPSENVFVNDANPIAFTQGQKDYSGSITILQKTIWDMEDDNPAAEDVTDLVFDLAASFTNGDVVKTTLWKNCGITEYSESHGQDTDFMEIELTIRIGKVERI